MKEAADMTMEELSKDIENTGPAGQSLIEQVEKMTMAQKKAMLEALTPMKQKEVMFEESQYDNWEDRVESPAPEQMKTPIADRKPAPREESPFSPRERTTRLALTRPPTPTSTRIASKRLEDILNHLCINVIQISIDSVFYIQDEVYTLLDLVTMTKEDIHNIVDVKQERKISKPDARLLQQLAWWYAYLASEYTDKDIPDEFCNTVTKDEFLKFRKKRYQ